MRSHGEVVGDAATLARLHAALDSVLETEHVIAAIQDSSARPPHAVTRVGALLGEARELLWGLLARREHRHVVGFTDTMAHRTRED